MEDPQVPQMSAQADEDIHLGHGPEISLPKELSERNKKTIEEANSMLQEYHDDVHRQAVVQ